MKKQQDLTLRNLRATKKREAELSGDLKRLIKVVDLTLSDWIASLETRIAKLETKAKR